MNEKMGLAHFWAHGDAVTHTVALLLLAMSVLSWTIILGKALAHLRLRLSLDRALEAFWSAESRALAVEALRRADTSGAFARVAMDAVSAAEAYEQHAARGMGGGIGAAVAPGDFI